MDEKYLNKIIKGDCVEELKKIPENGIYHNINNSKMSINLIENQTISIDERRIILQYMLKKAGEIEHARMLHAMLAILQKNLEKKVDMGYEFREYVEGCYSDQVFEDINCLINVGFASVKGHFKHVYRLTDFGRMDFDWLKKDKLKQEIKEEVDKVVKEYTKKELMDVVDEVRELCINYEDLFEKYKEDKDVQLIINGTRKENM